MSAAKHTQDGPWLDAGLTGRNPVITGGPLRLIKCDGAVVAFLPAWLDNANEAAEARANARLIAAAPELLEALRAMHDKTAELIAHLQATDRLRPCFNLPALDAASAAIAKATGSDV